jgi:hypothetical protein
MTTLCSVASSHLRASVTTRYRGRIQADGRGPDTVDVDGCAAALPASPRHQGELATGKAELGAGPLAADGLRLRKAPYCSRPRALVR